MTSQQEIERLNRVYRTYREDDAVQARWAVGNAGNQAIVAERTRLLRRLLRTKGFLPLDQRHILDVGCGTGQILAGFQQLDADPAKLFGVDLLADRIEIARNAHPELQFVHTNAEALPFEAERFDLVLLYTVFTSILDEVMARRVAAEIARVLKPGGAVVWYDFRYNNPWNDNVRAYRKRDIRKLFPNFAVDLHTLTLIPPIARRLGRWTSLIYPALVALPALRSHYLGFLIKPGPATA